LQGLTLEQLEEAIGAATKRKGVTLYDFVRDATDLDEAQFNYAIERNLRVGRILLLIVGEGIHEGVESLTKFLQLHAGLHVGIALVELSMWRLEDGALLVVPRTPMNTVIIERGVVVVDKAANVEVIPPAATSSSRGKTSSIRQVSLSEEEYFARLEAKRPGLKARLLDFATDLAALGVTLELGKTAVLRWRPSPQTEASLGLVDTDGKVCFSYAYSALRKAVTAELAGQYLDDIARAYAGQVRSYGDGQGGAEVLDAEGHGFLASRLLDEPDAWKTAIAKLIEATARLIRDQ